MVEKNFHRVGKLYEVQTFVSINKVLLEHGQALFNFGSSVAVFVPQ